ncbi:MAG: NifB/NifX family molybdenum-iron cluster-binding protein [Dehalococcoidales bacterium]
MKIAISATGPTLDAEVDPRFGRCQHFIIADPETMQFEVLDNSSAMAAGGAGISAAQMIAGQGVKAVLTGNCGPNAYGVLSAAGIQVITGVSGTVKDAVQQYKEGKFQGSSQANVPDHFGMGGAMGGGMGTGMGRGMGRGMRGGMGMGAEIMPPVPPTSQPLSQDQELGDLKTQSQMLAQQLSAMQQRIEELEKRS